MKTKLAGNHAQTWENTVPVVSQQAATFVPSPKQRAVLDWVENESGNAVIEAVAGAGKTTTLVAIANTIPTSLRGYAVVFNKRNADEMKARFPFHIECGTFHSLWLRAIRPHVGHATLTVDAQKTSKIITAVLPSETSHNYTSVLPAYRVYIRPISELIGYAKNNGVGRLRDNVPATYQDFIAHYDMQLEDDGVNIKALIDYTMKVLDISNKNLSTIDFDDMLYLPFLNNWGIYQKDFVLVDEAQDTNPVQIDLVKRMAKPSGRTIFVGDPHQAIYGFRGASNSAMEKIARMFKAKQLPLTVSFRCPQAVVKEAQKHVSHIEAHPTAPQGEVIRISEKIPAAYFEKQIAIVCRTTAPLVSFAFELIRNNIGCTVLGRDIGARLLRVVKICKIDNLIDAPAALEYYRAQEIEKAQRTHNETRATTVNDQVDSILAVLNALPINSNVETLVQNIRNLFSDTAGATRVVLSTVHKAKGLEWDTVMIIRPDLMPLPWIRQKWQRQQERNIAYVAVTRAKSRLIIVDGEKPEYKQQ